MASRRVLIVDDSKTAQIRLKKMLQRFEVDVDTVFSAEEALGYLSYKRPAAIFMDHHMEGMDGLEALKIIKSNPDTALIPVIMYTSEQGDVYVGQARALGALDIIGKEVIQHANIEKVLGSLGICAQGDDGAENSSQKKVEQPTEVPAKSTQTAKSTDVPHSEGHFEHASDAVPEIAPPSSLEQVQQQVGKLFELHIAKVRQEIEDSTKFLVRRLAKDSAEKKPARAQAKPADGKAPPELPIEPYLLEPQSEKSSGVSVLFLGVILLSIAVVGYHIHSINERQDRFATQLTEATESIKKQHALISRLFDKAIARDAAIATQSGDPFAANPILLDAMGWAVNVNTHIPFGEPALGDDRIYMLGDLLYLLETANFSGSVFLDVHLGNYCVAEDRNGGFILPDPASNLEDCVFLSDKLTEVHLDDQVSVGFFNYLNTAPALVEGKIDVDLSSEGFASPRASYPANTSATSAGEWNAIADKNNRIAVSFSSN